MFWDAFFVAVNEKQWFNLQHSIFASFSLFHTLSIFFWNKDLVITSEERRLLTTAGSLLFLLQELKKIAHDF